MASGTQLQCVKKSDEDQLPWASQALKPANSANGRCYVPCNIYYASADGPLGARPAWADHIGQDSAGSGFVGTYRRCMDDGAGDVGGEGSGGNCEKAAELQAVFALNPAHGAFAHLVVHPDGRSCVMFSVTTHQMIRYVMN